jgi:hypothetical protein
MLADTWMGNCATEAVDPTNPLQVTNWCRWFVAQFPDCATFAPLKNTPTGDALASTVAAALTIVAHQPGPEWPQGSDEEDAETLAAVGAVPAPTQASPDAGQANTDATEVAS